MGWPVTSSMALLLLLLAGACYVTGGFSCDSSMEHGEADRGFQQRPLPVRTSSRGSLLKISALIGMTTTGMMEMIAPGTLIRTRRHHSSSFTVCTELT